MVKRTMDKRQQRRLPKWEPPKVGRVVQGLSLQEAETLKIFAAIGEAIEGDKQRAGAVRGEDVREQAVRVVGEVSVSEEAP